MTENPTDKRQGRIADYSALIRAADGLTLRQICSLSGLEPSTIQNWVKRGFVPHPVNKKYRERHLARILLISELRESMQIDRVGELLRYVNGDADDESDDIIREEALYDLFLTVCETLDGADPAPDVIAQTVQTALCSCRLSGANRDIVENALNIMACTYMANCYKRKADSIWKEKGVNHG